MRPDEPYNYNNRQLPHPHRKLELFFFETEGNRRYLRFTRLAVILILCLIVIPMIVIFTLFLYNRASTNSEQINVNVRSSPSPDATPLRNVIIQAPTPHPPSPKIHVQPLPAAPILPTVPPESNRNMNEQPVPSQIPQHPPAKLPT